MQTPQDGKKREQLLAQRPAVSGRRALRCRQLFNGEVDAPPTRPQASRIQSPQEAPPVCEEESSSRYE